MTTREIYFKEVYLCEIPQALIGYVKKDDKGTIQIGMNVALRLNIDNDVAEKSIKIMKDIEKTEGFMFWNNSKEGDEFFNKNIECIRNFIFKSILK